MSDSNSPATQVLEDLLATIEGKLGMTSAAGGLHASEDTGRQTARGTSNSKPDRADAIAAVLNEEPRASAVVSLREAPAIEAFRQALTDGLIRVDTANRLLRLINEIIVRMVP